MKRQPLNSDLEHSSHADHRPEIRRHQRSRQQEDPRRTRKAIRAEMEGGQVVTVVSAMGHATDELVDLAKEITDSPPAREMDMLLSTGNR